MNLLIIGGTGEMGQWFSSFFKNRGFNVSIWGNSCKIEVANRLGVKYAYDLKNVIKKSDIVIISVPIDITENMIAKTAPLMKAGSLLMDFTSLKTTSTNAMQKYAPEDVEILGTHPMFGPTVNSLHGQRIILTPIEKRCTKWFSFINNFFCDNGAQVVIVSPQDHDKFVSVIQGLTHFAYINIGATLDVLNFNVKDSRRFMSPVYEIMLDFIGRILDQNPYLYALIQMENPEVIKVHDAFLNESHDTLKLVKEYDIEGFISKMRSAAIHFGDTSSALRRSDKLINFKIEEYDKLLNAINCEVALKHVYSEKIHIGILKKVTPTELILQTGKKNIFLKIENIQLLSIEQLKNWKINNLSHQNRDISTIIPSESDPEIILEIISSNENVVSAEIIDTYILKMKKSITYRIKVNADNEPNVVQKSVERTLLGIGCKIRV